MTVILLVVYDADDLDKILPLYISPFLNGIAYSTDLSTLAGFIIPGFSG